MGVTVIDMDRMGSNNCCDITGALLKLGELSGFIQIDAWKWENSRILEFVFHNIWDNPSH
jgi:hypothetical protein